MQKENGIDDFIFRILCQVLYDDLYSYDGLSLSHEDAENLEKTLVVEFKKNPDHYRKVLYEYDSRLADLAERFNFLD